ncbi:MAG: hypothetical protein AAF609_21285 [Cyanobacteria bacterium P01_C01_bin.120]
MPALHGQASQWYEQNELFADAIRHALSAQDFDHAADLIEQVWSAMRNRQQEATVLSWLKVLLDSLIRVRPVLSVVNAIALLNTGQTDAIEDRLQDAERALAQAKMLLLTKMRIGLYQPLLPIPVPFTPRRWAILPEPSPMPSRL